MLLTEMWMRKICLKMFVSMIYLDFYIIRAELKVSMLLAENNILLALANKLKAILLTIFPDSQIAQEYKMDQTKASCVLNESFVPYFLQQTSDIMKTAFYSLSSHGFNDTGLEKTNLVRLFDMIQAGLIHDFWTCAAPQVRLPFRCSSYNVSKN